MCIVNKLFINKDSFEIKNEKVIKFDEIQVFVKNKNLFNKMIILNK